MRGKLFDFFQRGLNKHWQIQKYILNQDELEAKIRDQTTSMMANNSQEIFALKSALFVSEEKSRKQ